MSNPFTVGASTVLPNGPGAGTDNLTALPSNTALGLGVIDNHTTLPYDLVISSIKIKSGASVSGNQTCSLYVITSVDNVIWTDGISPTSSSDQSAKIATAMIASVINVTAANTTYYFPEIDIPSLLGYMPVYVAVVVRNQSGATLATGSTNFAANSVTISYA